MTVGIRYSFFGLLTLLIFLSSCQGEHLRQQAEEIRRQEEEIIRQRNELEALRLAAQKREQQKGNCARAYEQFKKAQQMSNLERAIDLYQKGLELCPRDDVAHYELGKILYKAGQTEEAKAELDASLQINPNFQAARDELEKIRTKERNP